MATFFLFYLTTLSQPNRGEWNIWMGRGKK